jgi:exopolysaccharide/PEP-CTERM locus tyrosine autokinase
VSKLEKAMQRLRDSRAETAGDDPDGQRRVDKELMRRQKQLLKPSRRRTKNLVRVREGGGLAEEIPVMNRHDIPDEVRLASGLDASPEHEEQVARQFGRIKRPIMINAFDLTEITEKNANVVMLASALPGSGKTFCALNLAKSISQERDFGALLVDADVLKPRITRSLGLTDRPGLIDYLLDSDLTVDDILVTTDCDGIIVLPAGQKHRDATELLASRRMRQLVEELSQRFQSRVILFDTPPLLMTNEAGVLAQYMGQIAFVIEAGVTPTEAISASLELLDSTKPINAILNKTLKPSTDLYGGAGYYGYGEIPVSESDSVESEGIKNE